MKNILNLLKILENSSAGILIFDKNKNIVFNNLTFSHNIFKIDFENEDFISFLNKFKEFISEEFGRSNLEDISYEFEFTLKSGNLIWIKFDIKKEFDNNKNLKYLIITFFDITECKKKEFEYKKKSQIDFLTNVYNRNYFEEKLDIEIQRCTRSEKPLSILMIDVDNFKYINDNFGHNVGDLILKNIANIVKLSLHRKSDFVSRYGGDEFICLLPYTDSKGAVVVSNRINKKFDEIKFNNSLYEKITLSIGVYTQLPEKNIIKEKIIENVDKALYYSKKNGKNLITLYDDIYK
ncbi:MAG: GGDEF domain-containing protein [Spirochaetes bacterium]|nr:GGDEF domain-containing protein [Spirochaetota bacterium]